MILLDLVGMLDAFRLRHRHVSHVPETQFKLIKETPSLDQMMPPSLVWMEESLQGRRYFGLPAKPKPLKKVSPDMYRRAKQFVKSLSFGFAKFTGFCVEENQCWLLPNAFKVGSGKNPMHLKCFQDYKIGRDMEYMYGKKRLHPMEKFGYIRSDGSVNFERLSVDFNAYSKRLDDAIQACRDQLTKMRGGVVHEPPEKPTFDRSEYEMNIEIELSESSSSSSFYLE